MQKLKLKVHPSMKDCKEELMEGQVFYLCPKEDIVY